MDSGSPFLNRTPKRLVINKADTIYHIVSRTSCRQFLLDDEAKEIFRKIMWRQALFGGMEILSYCLMSNHFHILVRVPFDAEIPDSVLVKRYKQLYQGDHVPHYAIPPAELASVLKIGDDYAGQVRQRLKARMNDLPTFVRELKQRFTIWYNRTHDNKGTIWEGRYRSQVVGDEYYALSVISTYIDLNPVRAGIVDDPIEYRFCGYSEAIAGNAEMRRGLNFCLKKSKWKFTSQEYRRLLYDKGFFENRNCVKSGRVAPKKAAEVKREKGVLSFDEIMKCKVRYFIDGLAIGSEGFVEGIFKRHRDLFGAKRKNGARKLKKMRLGPLRVLRNLQVRGVEE